MCGSSIMTNVKCLYCGNEFERPKGSKQIYCSKKCRRLGWRARNPEKCKAYRERNLEYMNNVYRKDPEAKAKHEKWLQDNPLKKSEYDRRYVYKHLTEERHCVICGKLFKVIKTKELKSQKGCYKTCSEKCRKIYYYQQQRKWQREHPEQVRTKHKELQQNRKFSVMAIYSEGQPRCACPNCYYHTHDCSIDFLTIDHINNNGAEHRRKLFGNRLIGGYAFYTWIIKNNFPEDLQVLCMNCQFGRKFNNGVCPHEFQHGDFE